MPANKKTFDVYAHIRHARQQLGDRIEEIRTVDWKDRRITSMDKVYSTLDDLECQLERILKEDQV